MNQEKREFELREGYLYSKFEGEFNAENNLAHFRATLEECLKRGAHRVLCDLSGESGDLSFLSRFYLGDKVADFWDRRIKIAIYGREEQLDKDRFGVMVACNRGVVANAFSNFDEALTWLLA